MTATGALNNCGRAVPLVLHSRMLQLSDIEPGARKTEAPVPVASGARAIVVLANFCKTRGSCFYYVFDLANATGKEYKKHIALDLTADSTCIGPTPH